MRICSVVFTTQYEPWARRRYAVAETWGRDFDRQYMMSDDTAGGAVDAGEAHTNHVGKMAAGLRLALRDGPWDWVVASCDDAYINRANLERFLGTDFVSKARPAVWGKVIACWRDMPNLYYPAGCCQVFHPETLPRILDTKDYRPWLSDVWVGLRLSVLRIPLGSTRDLVNTETQIINERDWICVHHIEPERMRAIHHDLHRA